ncbi:hypothetical protein J5069_01310 [Candidatus Symbiopectobacterium sp. NZEC127]|uniref:ADP-ribosyltransferase n=1 Tax=Candidatus Symbiopectobacterium sp. NZEC127 TaxID=2820472 RepID=UPI002227C5C2|nr:ADP-ribosyltransferase [Candidatus Symbiopectobacterium sp. NZEC127]MCW2484524.1 hypothetical protein [Candidatus Symbiopectobacterium sp. NZEC127]
MFGKTGIITNDEKTYYTVDKKRGDIFFENAGMSLKKFYADYQKRMPSLTTLAASIMKKNLKEKFNLDIDPDKNYFMLFNSAMSCSDCFSGWCFTGKPIEYGSLSSYLLRNFPADAQENLVSVNSQSGIYRVAPDTANVFDRENEVQLLPTTFIQLVWDINFYQQASSIYTDIFNNKGIHSKKNFIDFIINLSSQQLSHRAISDLLSGAGLTKNNNVTAWLLDINGYQATDLIVFYNNSNRHVTLYLPRAENKFAEFDSIEDMRTWVLDSGHDNARKESIASHFSLKNRQDGVIYSGIDNWLTSQSNSVNRERDKHKIGAQRTPIASSTFFTFMANRQRECFFSDLDSRITSDAEVTRDIWERDIDASAILPNPITPLAALAIHLEHAFEGDTSEERQQEWNKVSNDIVNLVLMITLDKVGRFNTEGYEFIDKIKNSLAQESRAVVLDNTLSFEHVNVNIPEPEMLSATHHINLRTHNLPELDKAFFSETKPDAQGIFHYSDPHSATDKLAICIKNRFYAVRPGTFQGMYVLDDDREIVLFDGSYFERKQPPLERVSYTECRTRRAPGTSCTRISTSIQDALTRNRDRGFTKEDAMIIGRDPAHPALFINIEGKKFIGLDDRFFRIKEKENVFTIYARKRTGLLATFRRRKEIATFQFSLLQGEQYIHTPTEAIMETLGASRPAASLYNQYRERGGGQYQTNAAERRAINDYTRNVSDMINEYLELDMPEHFLSPLFAEQSFQMVTNIRSLLNKLPSFHGVVYRGGELSPELRATLKPGDTLLVKKFVSTSADKNIAMAHKAGKGPHQALYKIHVTHTAHAISGFTHNLHEAEVLIEDRTLFRCLSIEGDNVELKEVLDASRLDETNVKIASI